MTADVVDLLMQDLVAGKLLTTADLERYAELTGQDVRLAPGTLYEARDAFLDGAIPAGMAVLDDEVELGSGERFLIAAITVWHSEEVELSGHCPATGKLVHVRIPIWSPVYLWSRKGEPVIHRRPRIDLTTAG